MEYLNNCIARISDFVCIKRNASLTNLNPISNVPIKYINPEKLNKYGNIEMHKSNIEYKKICSIAKSFP